MSYVYGFNPYHYGASHILQRIETHTAASRNGG